MKTIVNQINLDSHIETSIYQIIHNMIFFDIETTGLGHYNKVMLIGIVEIKSTSSIEITQLFDDTGNDENEILKSFHKFIELRKPTSLVSFNGDAFDIPFINARSQKNNLAHAVEKRLNIDLLKIARKNKSTFKTEKLSLKSIESYLGIYRDDLISGAESVRLYKDYLKEKKSNLEKIILGHNFDDLKNMVPLAGILNLLSDSDLTLINAPSLIDQDVHWKLSDVKIKNMTLFCEFGTLCHHTILPLEINGHGYTLHLNGHQLNMSLALKKLHNESQILYFIDANKIYHQDLSSFSSDQLNQYVIQLNDQLFLQNILAHCKHLLSNMTAK